MKQERPAEVSKVAQSSPTLYDPMDCSLPGSSHGTFQERVLECVAISFSYVGSIKFEQKWEVLESRKHVG